MSPLGTKGDKFVPNTNSGNKSQESALDAAPRPLQPLIFKDIRKEKGDKIKKRGQIRKGLKMCQIPINRTFRAFCPHLSPMEHIPYIILFFLPIRIGERGQKGTKICFRPILGAFRPIFFVPYSYLIGDKRGQNALNSPFIGLLKRGQICPCLSPYLSPH